VLLLRQIRWLRRGFSSSRRRPSWSWMVTASSSKCTTSSRAFARGLPQWLALAAHLDLQRRRRALAAILAKIYLKWLQLRRVPNPKGFGFYL
jgi:hypothetical protein